MRIFVLSILTKKNKINGFRWETNQFPETDDLFFLKLNFKQKIKKQVKDKKGVNYCFTDISLITDLFEFVNTNRLKN